MIVEKVYTNRLIGEYEDVGSEVFSLLNCKENRVKDVCVS